jgi:Ca2+-binding RTX toxin-like protein
LMKKLAVLGVMVLGVLTLAGQAEAATSFAPAVNYATGNNPRSVITGHFNGDQFEDVAVANASSSSVSVLLGKGDGSFTVSNYALPSGTTAIDIAAGDLNGDGQTDLAIADHTSHYVRILFSNGNGTFSAPVNYSCWRQGCGPSDVAIFDMDGDRDADLAVANWYHDSVTTYRNSGSGQFSVYGEFPVGNRTNEIEAADLDNDGDADLAVGDSIGDYAFYALLNNGSGSFARPVGYGLVEDGLDFKEELTVGDFNNDGLKDVATSARTSNFAGSGKVYVLLGNGNGTFGAAKIYRTGGRAYAVTAANLDGDNALDLAVADVDSGVVVLPGDGDGTFGSATSYGVGTNPVSVVSGSFGGPSGAGADLAVANNGSANVSILLNTTPSATSCTITGTSGNDVLSGTSGRDVICGLGGADTLKGVEGEDVIKGGSGSDILQGNLGNDSVIGGGGADRLYGGEGNDALDSKDGVIGNDRLDGGAGIDTKVTDAREASIIGFP